ncbi:hypothetical protein F2Q70_00024873 [Brassica cretica]|uniref:At2g35280-like TPR domain-containing protein n=1 Tax=Brassica cretica TaxID=69181 RepID=A0A8S9LG79_BRACR|nr:hypothetical protein F2Q70_00024873 [Brassica cretica]
MTDPYYADVKQWKMDYDRRIPDSSIDLPRRQRRPHSLLLPYLVYMTRMRYSHVRLLVGDPFDAVELPPSSTFNAASMMSSMVENSDELIAQRMVAYPILDLPLVLQALVVQRFAKNFFADLYRLRSTCKSMRALADECGMYASFDLFNYPWYLGRRHTLLRRCYEEGNPSTLYVKGLEYLYGLDRLDEGLRLLKRAADAVYERAFCTYAMTRKILCEDEEYFSRFTRESVSRMGMVVRNEGPVWFNRESDRFITKRHLFRSTVVPLFYSCKCSPCLDRDWRLWYIEYNKAGDMCNRCFWIKKVALFLRDFRCSTDFPDFDTWQDRFLGIYRGTVPSVYTEGRFPRNIPRNGSSEYSEEPVPRYIPRNISVCIFLSIEVYMSKKRIDRLTSEEISRRSSPSVYSEDFSDKLGILGISSEVCFLGIPSENSEGFPRKHEIPRNYFRRLVSSGVVYFYGLDRLDEGLRLLKRAADAGYERAMGMVVRNEDPIWVNRENDRFITKRHLFMSTVIPLFYSCQCSPCLDRDSVLWYIEHSKVGDMCNRCFWIKEVALFLRDFRCSTGFPDFDTWQ